MGHDDGYYEGEGYYEDEEYGEEAATQRAMEALFYPGTGGEHAQTRLVGGPATLPR